MNIFRHLVLKFDLIFFQIWDLRAGKMMTEFNNHGGPVHDVEFHPHEFLLASGNIFLSFFQFGI
jgi:hypothetical protein